MAKITLTYGTIKLANVTAIRDEISRLRTKHGLGAITFGTTDAWQRYGTINEIKTQIKALEDSTWISTIDVTTIPDVVSGTKVMQTDFESIVNVMGTVDLICADNSPHYSPHYSTDDSPYDSPDHSPYDSPDYTNYDSPVYGNDNSPIYSGDYDGHQGTDYTGDYATYT